jgi:hypothetical protein
MLNPPVHLCEAARETPLWGEWDVLVLGGGPAGIAAAAAAARAGARTLLVERYGFLGGMGTAAGVTNFCGLHACVFGEIRQVVHGLADELLARIGALDGLSPPHLLFGGKTAAQAYDNAAYKIAADGLLAAHGAQVLFRPNRGQMPSLRGLMRCSWKPNPAAAHCVLAASSMPQAMATWRPGPARPLMWAAAMKARRSPCCTRARCSAWVAWPNRRGRSAPGNRWRPGKPRPKPVAATALHAARRSCGRKNTPASGAPTSARCAMPTARR